jgi:galactokinase
MSLAQLVDNARRVYAARFGMQPVWVAAAPGRVNLIGEHTDYNGGFVFPMAIERYTVIAAGPRDGDHTAAIWSEIFDETATFDLAAKMTPSEKVDWRSYVGGTISCALEKGIRPRPFNAVILSNVPLGGGLSSSASLEVSVATLLEAISGQTLDPVEKALLCQKAEHEYAFMPCGIMDQFISTMAVEGHAMLLDCRSFEWQAVPLDDPNVAVLVTNSNVKHTLSGSEYPERRADCARAAELLGVELLRDTSLLALEEDRDRIERAENGTRVYRRARHFLTEEERVARFAEALRHGDLKEAGRAMFEGHRSLKEDYEVTCSETDKLVEIAKTIGVDGGVYGARMTGGGFGGCTVTLVEKDKADAITRRIVSEYKVATGIDPTIFVTRPAAGARIV